MYVVVNADNTGSARTDSRELANELAKCIDGYVKLFADWKGPNKASFKL
jgi:hypothetical protein